MGWAELGKIYSLAQYSPSLFVYLLGLYIFPDDFVINLLCSYSRLRWLSHQSFNSQSFKQKLTIKQIMTDWETDALFESKGNNALWLKILIYRSLSKFSDIWVMKKRNDTTPLHKQFFYLKRNNELALLLRFPLQNLQIFQTWLAVKQFYEWFCDLGSRKGFKIAEYLWKEYSISFKFKPHLTSDFPQFSRNWLFCLDHHK